jgi:acetyl esterase/lipase
MAAVAVGACSKPDDQERRLEGYQPVRYGDDQSQVAELLLPDAFGPYPVVVLIHGGWWQPGWDRRGVRELARDIVREGYATWNLEYRLVGEPGGGWPGTFEDIAAGVDKLAEKAGDFNFDLTRVIFLGHSAGGQLALWAASRSTFEPGFVGADPAVTPTTVISLAGVCDLVTGAEENLGNGAIPALMGGMPDEVPLSYLSASPIDLDPGPSRHVLVHSVADEIVPVTQSQSYVEVATSRGADVEYIELEDADHFTVIDTSTDEWEALLERLDEFSTPPEAT